jgi:hypothetical protein
MSRNRILSCAALVAATIFAMSPAVEAVAQTYPVNNPTYIPTAVLAASSLSAPGDVTFNVNGLGSVVMRIAGTNTGVAGTFQVTESRASSPTWQTVGVTQIGGTGGAISAITGNGVYRINTTGLAQVRFHLTGISTGSISVSGSGSPAAGMVHCFAAPPRNLLGRGHCARPGILGHRLLHPHRIRDHHGPGQPGRVLRRQHRGRHGHGQRPDALDGQHRRHLGGGDGGPARPNDPAAVATVLGYTANPTTGTLVGVLRSGKLSTNTAASSAFGAQTLAWTFGEGTTEEVTLRGVAQVFALNGAGASFTSGAVLNCSVSWTEE